MIKRLIPVDICLFTTRCIASSMSTSTNLEKWMWCVAIYTLVFNIEEHFTQSMYCDESKVPKLLLYHLRYNTICKASQQRFRNWTTDRYFNTVKIITIWIMIRLSRIHNHANAENVCIITVWSISKRVHHRMYITTSRQR